MKSRCYSSYRVLTFVGVLLLWLSLGSIINPTYAAKDGTLKGYPGNSCSTSTPCSDVGTCAIDDTPTGPNQSVKFTVHSTQATHFMGGNISMAAGGTTIPLAYNYDAPDNVGEYKNDHSITVGIDGGVTNGVYNFHYDEEVQYPPGTLFEGTWNYFFVSCDIAGGVNVQGATVHSGDLDGGLGSCSIQGDATPGNAVKVSVTTKSNDVHINQGELSVVPSTGGKSISAAQTNAEAATYFSNSHSYNFTIDTAIKQLGSYDINFSAPGIISPSHNIYDIKNQDINLDCTILDAIKLQGNAATLPILDLPDPKTPVAQATQTLGQIQISHLEPNTEYTLWKSGDSDSWSSDHGQQLQTTNKRGVCGDPTKCYWTDQYRVKSDARGLVKIFNVCQDGEANRSTGDGTSNCSDYFHDGKKFGITVIQVSPKQTIGEVDFSTQLSASLSLLYAPSPMDDSVKTITFLEVGGLANNDYYQFNLNQEWDVHNGGNIGINGNNTFQANSGGSITVKNICTNGNAERTNCTSKFHEATYYFDVRHCDDGQPCQHTHTVGTLNFPVAKPSGGSQQAAPCTNTNCHTAIGDVNPTPGGFINLVLDIGIGVGGTAALLIILYGAFRILTSNGDAEAVKNGRALITSAIAGLVFILASVFLLNLVGGNLLGIPGFNGNVTPVQLPGPGTGRQAWAVTACKPLASTIGAQKCEDLINAAVPTHPECDESNSQFDPRKCLTDVLHIP